MFRRFGFAGCADVVWALGDSGAFLYDFLADAFFFFGGGGGKGEKT